MTSFTRRSFLKGAGAVGLLAASIKGVDLLPGASAQEPADPLLSGAQKDILQRFFGGNINAFKHAQASGGIEQIVLDEHQEALARASPYFGEVAAGKEYFLITTPAEGIHAVGYAGGSYHFERGGVEEVFLDRTITPEIVDVIRRLYDPEHHIKDDPEHSIEAFRWDTGYDFRTVSDHQLVVRLNERLPDHLKLDRQTISTALENLVCARDCGEGNDASFLQALELFSRDARPYASEKVSAGIWYLASMKDMGTKRLVSPNGGKPEFDFLPDLHQMDRVTFLETVDYAVQARHRWGWASSVPLEQFLEYVLPARTSDEPLQPWRRHVFEALAPALDRLAAQGAGTEEVISFINEVGAALFRPKILGWTAFSPALRYAAHVGKCQDENGLVSDMLRAAGIAVARAYTPAWSGSGNHVWFVYFREDGTLGSRMGCEPSPKDPRRYMDGEVIHTKVHALPPGTPSGGVDLDLTRHFTGVTELSFSVPAFSQPPKTYHLNALSGGNFVTVASAPADGDAFVFPDVGCGAPIVYSVSSGKSRRMAWSELPVEGEVVPPFLLLPRDGLAPERRELNTGPLYGGAFRAMVTCDLLGAPVRQGRYLLQTWLNGGWYPVTEWILPSAVAGGAAPRELEADIYPDRLYQLVEVRQARGGQHEFTPCGFPFATLGSGLQKLRGEVAR